MSPGSARPRAENGSVAAASRAQELDDRRPPRARGWLPRNASVTWKVSTRRPLFEASASPASDVVRDVVRELERDEEPDPVIPDDRSAQVHAAVCRLSNNLRTRWSEAAVARPRIMSRSPGSSVRTDFVPSGPTACANTSPDRLLRRAASGPATPVTATATSAPRRTRAPVAIAAATSSETAPCSAMSSAGTPSPASFTPFAYATTEPTKTSLAPGTLVSREATMPPVHDSAVASVRPRVRQRSRTISEIGALVLAEEVVPTATRASSLRSPLLAPAPQARRTGRRGSRTRARRS